MYLDLDDFSQEVTSSPEQIDLEQQEGQKLKGKRSFMEELSESETKRTKIDGKT